MHAKGVTLLWGVYAEANPLGHSRHCLHTSLVSGAKPGSCAAKLFAKKVHLLAQG